MPKELKKKISKEIPKGIPKQNKLKEIPKKNVQIPMEIPKEIVWNFNEDPKEFPKGILEILPVPFSFKEKYPEKFL